MGHSYTVPIVNRPRQMRSNKLISHLSASFSNTLRASTNVVQVNPRSGAVQTAGKLGTESRVRYAPSNYSHPSSF